MVYVYLAVGGVFGTFARYALGGWIYSWAGTFLPWGTFAVNVFGSFLFGFLTSAMQGAAVSPDVRTMWTAGFCGAFATLSVPLAARPWR